MRNPTLKSLQTPTTIVLIATLATSTQAAPVLHKHHHAEPGFKHTHGSLMAEQDTMLPLRGFKESAVFQNNELTPMRPRNPFADLESAKCPASSNGQEVVGGSAVWNDFEVRVGEDRFLAKITVFTGIELGDGTFKKTWEGSMTPYQKWEGGAWADHVDAEPIAVAVSEIDLLAEDGLTMVREEEKLGKLVGARGQFVQGENSNILTIFGSAYYKEGNLTPTIVDWDGRGRYVIVSNLCSGGELGDVATDEDEDVAEIEAGVLMYQFMLGLKVMHDMNVAHRDIKGQNALLLKEFDSEAFRACFTEMHGLPSITLVAERCLPKGSVKVMDFGFSKPTCEVADTYEMCKADDRDVEKDGCVGNQDKCVGKHTLAGSPVFLAPEATRRLPYKLLPTDIYSAGVMWFELQFNDPQLLDDLCDPDGRQGAPVCSGRAIQKALTAKSGEMSAVMKTLLTKMLSQTPSARPTVDEVLGDAFFQASWTTGFMDDCVCAKEPTEPDCDPGWPVDVTVAALRAKVTSNCHTVTAATDDECSTYFKWQPEDKSFVKCTSRKGGSPLRVTRGRCLADTGAEKTCQVVCPASLTRCQE